MDAHAKIRFLAAVREMGLRHGLLPPRLRPRARREPLLLAISGGPDSVALLLALVELSRTDFAVRPVVAHLHHGLRGRAADADRAFVRRLARRLHLRCITQRMDVRRLARRRGIGIEEAGRAARREFLARTARQAGARLVALGHTADDRAETVLFNILRGTGIDGLAAPQPRAPLARPDECGTAGLSGRGEHPQRSTTRGGSGDPPRKGSPGPPTVLRGGSPQPPRAKSVEIIRPLLGVTRAEVLAYLAAEGQDFRRDRSNASRAFARNRLRHELLPLVRRRFNPRATEALARLSDQAAAAAEVLADALDDTWRRIVREAPRTAILIDADDFASLRPWMQGAILRRAVERLGGGLKHMSADRTREVAAALLARPAAGPIPLPGGLAAQRRRGIITIG
ncbi:MAG: tRNA lysidine(34) synthetase TilS [Planctomycetes bacterium]|nr:tRNA lysidine(34) synthetase TilS [Planctomycetota bacterium]